MARPFKFFAAAVAWLLTVTVVLAADPLTVIPDTALGVAVINNLSDTSARIQKLTTKMQLPVPELLPLAQLYSGAQQGVDDKGTIAAAAFVDKSEDASLGMSMAVFVPVTDYKAFVAQLTPDDANAKIAEVTVMGSQYLVTQKGEFAVLASTDGKALLEQIVASTAGVAGTLEPIKPWLANQQIALVATPSGKKLLVEKLGGFLDDALKQADKDKADDKEDGDKKDEDADDDSEDADDDDDDAKAAAAPGANVMQSLTEMMRSVKDIVDLADKQLTQLGVGIRIDDTTAFHLSTKLLFVPDGELAKWAAGVKAPAKGLLAGLPAGKFTLAYGGVSTQMHSSLAKLIDRMTETGLSQMGLNDADRKKFAEATGKMRANQVRTAAILGQMRPGDSIMSTAVTVETVKDSALQFKTARDLFQVMAAAKPKGGDEAKPIYSINEIKVGDLNVLEMVTDMNAAMQLGAGGADLGPAQAQMQGMFGKLFGGDGEMHAYLTVADGKTVVTAYSKELLTHAVAHVRAKKAGLETDESIAKTAVLLPEGAQWAAYLNPQGLVQWIDAFVKALPGELGIKIPPFPASDPIGFGAKVAPTGVDAEMVLPESVVAGIGQYVGTITQMLQGGGELP